MSAVDLDRLLASIGMGTFVKYFAEFGDPNIPTEKMVELLPEEYTLKSRRARTSHARRIFREGLVEQALHKIAASDRLDEETRNNAQNLMAQLRRFST
jgi:hypothetical protein